MSCTTVVGIIIYIKEDIIIYIKKIKCDIDENSTIPIGRRVRRNGSCRGKRAAS